MKSWQQSLPVSDVLPELPDLSSRMIWARKNIVRASQAWVAAEASALLKSTISQQYVASIESGASRHPKHLDVLSIVLGVPLEWLYEGRGADGPIPLRAGIHKTQSADLVFLKDTVLDKRLWSHEKKDIHPWVLYVNETLVQSRLQVGDLLVVERGRDPKPGEYAVVRSQDFGYFVRMTSMVSSNGKNLIQYVDDLNIQPPIPLDSVDTLGTVLGIMRGMIRSCLED